MTRLRLSFAVAALCLVLPLTEAAAAGPQQGITLQVPANPLTPVPPRPPAVVPPANGFQPAPLPNRDIDDVPAPRASTEPSLRPSLFTRTDTYRGDGFSKGSTATSEQERRVRPGVGLNLRMPFSPN